MVKCAKIARAGLSGVAIASNMADTVTIRLRTMKKLAVQINTLDAQWTV